MHNLKLQRTHRGEERDFDNRIIEVKHLDDAFLKELFEALAELFVFSRVRILQKGKALWRKPWNFVINHARFLAQGVANAKFGISDQPQNVTRISFIDCFAFLREEFV